MAGKAKRTAARMERRKQKANRKAQNLLVRTVGPNKADRMCEERGWL